MANDIAERLARLEEKIGALISRVDNQDDEFKRRLGELNGEHRRIAEIVRDTQTKEQARSDVDKVFAKIDANATATDLRVKSLENASNVSVGRSWLPNIIIAAAAAGLGAWLAATFLR